ncbi:Uncharacterised protein [Fusobacterium necrophorum subsp. necrophorum]|nr:Uncharacterised protein [Fusobacterium necrophorum subsp. necrophorum]
MTRIVVVSIGPGSLDYITEAARKDCRKVI